MNLKHRLELLRINIGVYYRIFMEALIFLKKSLRHNASVNTSQSEAKMQYTLLRENHVIEKGLSMKDPKNGFGQEKVAHLIDKLNTYTTLYPKADREQVLHILSTINVYVSYLKGNGNGTLNNEALFYQLLKKINVKQSELIVPAGIKCVCKNDILNSCNSSFDALLNSRHSIRYFDKTIPDPALIDKALCLAQQTPSACNRQAWMAHVFTDGKSHSLLKDQGGCRGFEDEIHCSILVTSNLNAFLSYEVHQAYVDGGMYAMNLINSLHSLGLGTIPLSCGFYYSKLDAIMKKYNIQDNEIPIVIIGVGNLLEKFNVAISTRKSITKTSIYH